MKRASDFPLLSMRGGQLNACQCDNEIPDRCSCIDAEKAVRYLSVYGAGQPIGPAEREEMLLELQRLGQPRRMYQAATGEEVARSLVYAWVVNASQRTQT